MRIDGRLILLLAVAGFALAMLTYWSDGRLVVWRSLGVPAIVPEFADTHGITSAWECSRNGYNVLHANPCDSFSRPMNYPRLWTLPARLGLGQGSTAGVALFFAAAFIAAVLLVAGPLTAGPTVIYALALASPSVLLAVERGNNDLFIFALVAGAVLMLARQRPAGATLVLFAATALKLYPIVAIGALRDRRQRLLLVLATGAYLLFTSADLRLIRAGTPHLRSDWTYGLRQTAAALLPDTPRPWAVVLLAAGGVVAALVLARWFRTGATEPRTEAAFTAGASIYVATYALGPSFDYRLIFLLLTLPLSIEMARSRRPVLLALTLLVLWLSRDSASPLFIVDQVLQFVLAVACTALLLGPLVPAPRLKPPVNPEA